MAASILIVDDDAVARRLIENMVQKCGYETLVVESGDAAIAMLAAPDAPAIDAVVLDLVMPGLDGMGVLAKIREAGLNIPVIVQTAHGGIDNVVSAMRAGAQDFVVKPVGIERLQVSLRNALNASALKSELRRIKHSREGRLTFADIITRSDTMAGVLRTAQKAASSTIPVLVDVRIISATNRKLLERVKSGHFREDLFYRLHVLPLTIPPLRMRREDIPHLLRHFLARFCAEENRLITGISGEAMAHLSQLEWPGNIRQLENAVYRAVVMSDGDQLSLADFPQAAAQSPPMSEAHSQHSEPLVLGPGFHSTAPAMVSGNEIPIVPLPSAGTLAMLTTSGEMRPLEEMESEIIRFAISHYRGQMSEVARRLKIGRSTLYRKLDEAPTEDPAAGGAHEAN